MDDEYTHLATPAGRLWRFLDASARAAKKSTQQKPVGMAQVVRDFARLEHKDTAGYYAALAAVMALPSETRKRIEALQEPALPHEYLLRPLAKVEQAFPLLARGANAKQFADTVGDAALAALEACSNLLAKGGSVVAVEEKKLDTIRENATAVLDALTNDTELSPAFKERIAAYAQDIITGVNMYRVHGPDGLLKRVDSLAGVVIRNGAEYGEHKRNSVFDRIGKVVVAATTLLTLATAPPQIAATVEFYKAIAASPVSTEAPGDTNSSPVAEHAAVDERA